MIHNANAALLLLAAQYPFHSCPTFIPCAPDGNELGPASPLNGHINLLAIDSASL